MVDSSSESKRALVTGGSRGLGLAVAIALAENGYEVHILARDKVQLEKACAGAAAQGLRLQASVVDVTDESAVARFFEETCRNRAFDVVVNNVGQNSASPIVRRSSSGIRRHRLESWQNTMNLCLTSVFLCGREAAAWMLQHESPGVIINISSAARHGAFAQSAYSAAKAGVDALTRTWAIELGQHRVRVVGIAPGVINGQALRDRFERQPAHREYMEKLKQMVPLCRFAEEQEVAHAVLLAAENQYMTGTVIEVDGGGLPRSGLVKGSKMLLDSTLKEAATQVMTEIFGEGSAQRARSSSYFGHPSVLDALEFEYATVSDTTHISYEEHFLMGMCVLLATGRVTEATHCAKVLCHLKVPEDRIREAVVRLTVWSGGLVAMELVHKINLAIVDYREHGLASIPWLRAPQ